MVENISHVEFLRDVRKKRLCTGEKLYMTRMQITAAGGSAVFR